jgi:hypothetical protein
MNIFNPRFLLQLALILVCFKANADGVSIKRVDLQQELVGAWQVTSAHFNLNTARRRVYEWNDPRLIGRTMEISKGEISTYISFPEFCKNAKFGSHRTSAGNQLEISMPERGYPPQSPRTEHYELPIKNNAQIEVFTAYCTKSNPPTEFVTEIDGIWFTEVSNGKLAMRWHGDVILFIEKIKSDAIPNPSFLCDKAKTTTEKAICKSISLANFDRSIASSYTEAKRLFTEIKESKKIEKLKSTQNKWLITRNECGNNSECLMKSMASRLQDIADLGDLVE